MNTGAKAQAIFEALIEQGVLQDEGSIRLNFLGIDLPIEGNNAIGDLMQEWLSTWMRKNGFVVREPSDKQEAPDFFLGDSNHRDLLEVKFFTKSPNFDLAYWDAFVREIPNAPHRLLADYLVFEYTMQSGVLMIRNVWLKKLWELAAPSQDLPLKFQRKEGKLVNLRPATFYSVRSTFKPFRTLDEFLDACEETLNTFKGKAFATNWRDTVDEGLLRLS